MGYLAYVLIKQYAQILIHSRAQHSFEETEEETRRYPYRKYKR